MQRILPRGEIESLDHTHIPRIFQAESRFVFQERASRLRQLATDSPIQAYLLLMAHVADAQHNALAKYTALPGASAEQVDRAQAHGMPPLQATGWQRDPQWRQILADIVQEVLQQPDVLAAAQTVLKDLLQAIEQEPEQLEALADAILARFEKGIDAARATFVMAALQVYWTRLAVDFDTAQLPVITPFGVCPCCGSLPVSTIVRIGGSREGMRYATCSLCSTEWHIVRVTCTHCEDTEKIAYHSIADASEAIKAESCGKCHTYRKIFYQEKDQMVEAVADDLASLELDVLMGDEGFFRVNDNPLLWQSAKDS